MGGENSLTTTEDYWITTDDWLCRGAGVAGRRVARIRDLRYARYATQTLK
jgi:hypothetical protein